jgi:hypothetical protein
MKQTLITMALVQFLFLPYALRAELRPNAVFREFIYSRSFLECESASPNCPSEQKGLTPRELALDLDRAIAAEIAVEFTQHIGTSNERVRVNGQAWIDLPLPKGTSNRPECYYRESPGRPAVPIPLEHLRNGRNEFQFAAGPQVCHGFNWGLLSVYSFTVRIYYGPAKPHPTGSIVIPSRGERLGKSVLLRARCTPAANPITQVDFIGEYEDVNWAGDGVARQWQYQLRAGALTRHLGTATSAPYEAVWNTEWIPDQALPVKLMARIQDSSGMCFTTAAVESLTFNREYSVRVYPASSIPEQFGVRLGKRMTCPIRIGDDLSRADAARLWVPTHFARHLDERASEIGLNGTKISTGFGSEQGSYDFFELPASLLRGENEFYIRSDTEHHAAEINWPGPALVVRFRSLLSASAVQ